MKEQRNIITQMVTTVTIVTKTITVTENHVAHHKMYPVHQYWSLHKHGTQVFILY